MNLISLKLQSSWPAWILTGAITLLPVLVVNRSNAQEAAATPHFRFGAEVDALPFATGGYYGSAFVGKDALRVRYVVARTNMPSFMVSDGFKDKRTDAYALLVDRFLGANRSKEEGLWIGGGAEYWRNRIRTEKSPVYTEYQNYLTTLGGGYVWRLSRHVYLNPWAGGHLVIARNRDISVGGAVYKQPLFTPEGSVKIGFTF